MIAWSMDGKGVYRPDEHSGGPVPPGLARGLVLLQPDENGMAEQPVFRPAEDQ